MSAPAMASLTRELKNSLASATQHGEETQHQHAGSTDSSTDENHRQWEFEAARLIDERGATRDGDNSRQVEYDGSTDQRGRSMTKN
ncbi:hypothetical protein [Salinigranum sp. GCM10025319]|uniref:hypothetical protein n=1 Tax=Salinigranum sp. GCM10025319 TaxID=3252687 RepID=UPI003615D0B0